MSCFLTRNIKHTCEYNAGGIAQIFMIDIRYFKNYIFKDDRLFSECFVEKLEVRTPRYIELDVFDGSNFIESNDNGIYTQEIKTFVRSITGEKTSNLLLSVNNKYVVMYCTYQGRMFSFGSDGGASINFNQQTGSLGEGEGYNITISKKSIYPLFELDIRATNITLLSTEGGKIVTSEDMSKLFRVK